VIRNSHPENKPSERGRIRRFKGRLFRPVPARLKKSLNATSKPTKGKLVTADGNPHALLTSADGLV